MDSSTELERDGNGMERNISFGELQVIENMVPGARIVHNSLIASFQIEIAA